MEPVTFKQALCQIHHLDEQNYRDFVLKRTLFRRVRLVAPLIRIAYPDFLFNEIRLVDKIGAAHNLREIQEEVDFYQHKYVVNFMFKEALRFRISGMKIIGLAHKVFQQAASEKSRQPALAS